MCENQEEPVVKKSMVETVAAVSIVSATIFVLKAVGQAIAGWMGLTLFKKLIAWYKKKRSKNGKGVNSQVPENEPAEASQHTLSGRRNGRRILRRKSEPD